MPRPLVVEGREVLHRAVVPHEKVAHLPAVRVPEARFDDALGEFLDERQRRANAMSCASSRCCRGNAMTA